MARINLRKLFTNEDIISALQNNKTLVAAAAELGAARNVVITSQLLSYWKKQLAVTNKNGDPVNTSTKLNKKIRETMELRSVGQSDYDRILSVPSTKWNNDRILVIPDQHAPYHHVDTIEFLHDLASMVNPTRIINLGDEVDNHGLSMHDSDPNLDSAGVELAKAKEFLSELAKLFPVMDICHSNHGSLVYRRAMKFGIPVEYIKSYRDILFDNTEGDGWAWHDKIKIRLPNGDLLIAQHQSAGDTIANAAHERAHIIEGHEHSKFEITYRSSSTALYWVVISGCLVDRASLAFAYGKMYPKKPIIGATVIIDSQPVLIPMPQDDDGRYTGKINGIFA